MWQVQVFFFYTKRKAKTHEERSQGIVTLYTAYCTKHPDKCKISIAYCTHFTVYYPLLHQIISLLHDVEETLLRIEIPLCIAQAASLTSSTPADYSTSPPALDEKSLQVNFNWRCVLYTFCGIITLYTLYASYASSSSSFRVLLHCPGDIMYRA